VALFDHIEGELRRAAEDLSDILSSSFRYVPYQEAINVVLVIDKDKIIGNN
jgi:hypothetical protein